MKKRRLVLLGAVLVISFAAALAFPTSHFLLLGWLRNEAFYSGRPTSYWISALKEDSFVRGGPAHEIRWSLAEGGPAAVPVLVEMLKDGDEGVREQALHALRAIGPAAKGAIPALTETLETTQARSFHFWQGRPFSELTERQPSWHSWKP